MSAGDSFLTRELEILHGQFALRRGRVIPAPGDVALSNGAVEIPATFLYTDLAASTDLATHYPPEVAAKVVRSFLELSTRAIRSQLGQLRSFDGDRVLGIFYGEMAEVRAVRAAMLVRELTDIMAWPLLYAKFPVLEAGGFKLTHCSGIDSGNVMTIKVGIRANNDLAWIGRAPNVAAKLSALRQPNAHTVITERVHSSLPQELRFDSAGCSRWTRFIWQGPSGDESIYASTARAPEMISPPIASRAYKVANHIRERARN